MLDNFTMCEVEIHSFCNRRCSFCPNAQYERPYEELNKEAYLNLVKDLSNTGFEGAVSFSRYNEPLADIPLLTEYVSLGKHYLPNCVFVTNTNGDFLHPDIFYSGIDELSIMDYDHIGFKECLGHMLNNYIQIDAVNGYYIAGSFDNVRVRYDYDWRQDIIDRAGTVDIKNKELRNRPCTDPSTSILIDVNGSVMPCCNMRNDLHPEYVLGNINDNSIIDILYSEKAVRFREELAAGILPEPCEYCQKEPGRYVEGHEGIYHEVRN
jgi:radical SAM protein with 4Fe4S-binding SPASM domain